MRRTLTLILGVALFGILAAVVVASQGSDDPVGSTTATTETTDRTTTVEDRPQREGVDISGPCDEAEHANDPRCTGAPSGRGDNSGPGSVNSGRDDDHGGDDDSSGRGRGGDND